MQITAFTILTYVLEWPLRKVTVGIEPGWTDYVTLLLSIVIVVITTLGVRAAVKTLGAVEKQAKIASDTLEAMIAKERARLTMERPSGDPVIERDTIDGDLLGGHHIWLNVLHFGLTDAYDVRVRGCAFYSAESRGHPSFEYASVPSSIRPENKVTRIRFEVPMSIEVKALTVGSDYVFTLQGEISYNDIYGISRRTTTFHYVWEEQSESVGENEDGSSQYSYHREWTGEVSQT